MFFELGKLISGNGGTTKATGLSGSEYLNKVRSILEEMNLTFDLQELERFSKR